MKIGQYGQRQRCRHVELKQFWQAFASRGFVSDSWAFLLLNSPHLTVPADARSVCDNRRSSYFNFTNMLNVLVVVKQRCLYLAELSDSDINLPRPGRPFDLTQRRTVRNELRQRTNTPAPLPAATDTSRSFGSRFNFRLLQPFDNVLLRRTWSIYRTIQSHDGL